MVVYRRFRHEIRERAQLDPNRLLPYVRFRATKLDRRLSARGRSAPVSRARAPGNLPRNSRSGGRAVADPSETFASGRFRVLLIVVRACQIGPVTA
jgi:hypothetical protein